MQLLNLVTGNLDREGGTLFTTPAIDSVGRGLVGKGHHDAWRSRVRGLPETAGELPVSALREEIETPGEGQIRALLTMSGNPVLSTPDGSALGRAMEGLDFMAAVDIYVNETTRHADVILPPTTALERDHYDLVFHTLAVRNTARFTPAVIDKDRSQRHDWEIYREVTLRLMKRLNRKPPLKKRLATRARLMASPTFLVAQLLRTGKSGVTISQLRKNPAGVDLGPLQAGRLPERLFTKSKRVDAAPDLVLADLARLDQVEISPRDGELVLIGRRHQRDNNSWMHNTERLTRGKPRHQLLMHPDDLAARGITDGNRVTVRSRVGSVEVEVQAVEQAEAPAAHAPRRSRRPRDRRRQPRHREVEGRLGRGRGPGRRRHDARRGVAPPRLRSPGRWHGHEPGRQGSRGLDQRPDRSSAARRVRQRRAERRTGRRDAGLTEPRPGAFGRRRIPAGFWAFASPFGT